MQSVGNITWCEAGYQSARGEIRSNWSIRNRCFHLDVTLPPNTARTVYVLASNADHVRESGQPANKAPGVHFLRKQNGDEVYAVNSGTCHFAAPVNGLEPF